jgi:hypothetical protein
MSDILQLDIDGALLFGRKTFFPLFYALSYSGIFSKIAPNKERLFVGF